MTDLLDIGAVSHRFTPVFLSAKGSYGLSASRLPYYISTIRLTDLKTYLSIVEDLPTDLTTGWRLQELYQREIDWDRVKREIVSEYLRAETKLKFFNAITVALLPRAKDGPILSTFESIPDETDLPSPPEVAKGWKRTSVGSVEIYNHPTADLAYLRWDTERAIAAVIDGQHRVAALRSFAEIPMTSHQHDTQIPVIFLVLDNRAGFDLEKVAVTNSSTENKILHVVRELFIDLNKHAVEVTRVRQILMDDRDMSSIGLRNLLADRAAEYNPVERRIPLGVVDWQTDKAKFERGPFITTVVLLHICIQDMLALQEPKDPTDPDQITIYVESINGALEIDKLIAKDPRFEKLSPLSKYVESEYIQPQRPMSGLPAAYLNVAEYAFERKWKPYLDRVFLDFRPYKEVVAKAHAAGALDGEWAQVAALPARAFKNYWDSKEAGAKESIIDKPTEQVESFKRDKWPFFGVFQKGMMKATAYLVRHEDIFTSGKGSEEERRAALADEWVSLLNYLDERGLLAKEALLPDKSLVWSGIVLRDKTIKWSGPAVNAIGSLLLVWFFRRRDTRKREKSFYSALRNVVNADQYPDFVGSQAGKVSSKSWLGKLELGVKAHFDSKTGNLGQIESRMLQLIKLVEPLNATAEAIENEETSLGLPLGDASSEDDGDV